MNFYTENGQENLQNHKIFSYLIEALLVRVPPEPVEGLKIIRDSSSTLIPSKEAAFWAAAGLENCDLLLFPVRKQEAKNAEK